MDYFYIAISLLVIAYIGYRLLKKGADRATDFFWNACNAYVFHGDEVAREAASMALAVAVEKQRKSMVVAYDAFKVKLLESGVLLSTTHMQENQGVILERFDKLGNDFELLSKSSIPMSSLAVLKAAFKDEHPVEAQALAKFDANFYIRKYPDIDFDPK